MPDFIESFTKKTKKYAKDIISGGNLFEEMGLHYIGPIDGHDVCSLVDVFRRIKDAEFDSSILVHIKTEKGKGFNSPDCSAEGYHAVKKFDMSTKIQVSMASKKAYTKHFAESMIDLMNKDDSVVGITAAMPSGTGLGAVASEFPDRIFDVGIAEQHAVTFAGGLTLDGMKPFCAIYSTFLQRAYDQIVHDISIQSLPVRFILDRAGLVGMDGPTHAGVFDLAYISNLPNFIVMAPSDELELKRMISNGP